jgi:abequosyltransferase
MAEAVKLSICMPTYNFGAFIGETLESIVSQLEPGVEIIVFDGGSQDDTAKVVSRFTRTYPAVSYVRQPMRGGIDRDMARSVELARGEYCWLFSSDDIMKPGAIARVMSEIESGLDIYVCGLTLCDRDMHVITDHRVSRAPWGSTFDLRDAADRHRYFELAETTTALFSFMGSIILRRRRWLEHGLDESYIGSCWAHVVRILRMISSGLTLKYLGESLQLKRGDNDSFMDKGLVHRYSIAVDGYHRIAKDVFGEDSFEARQMRRVIVNEYPPKAFFFAKVQCTRSRLPSVTSDVAELDRLATKAYRDPSLRNFVYLMTYRMLPVWVYERARMVFKRLRRIAA